MKVESGAALILRALCWSSVTSGIPRKALERTRSVANTVLSYQKVRVQSVSQSGDRESGVGGSVASHNFFRVEFRFVSRRHFRHEISEV